MPAVGITDDVGNSSAGLDTLATLRFRQMTTNDLVDEHIGEALLVFQNIKETPQVGWYEVTADNILRCQPSILCAQKLKIIIYR